VPYQETNYVTKSRSFSLHLNKTYHGLPSARRIGAVFKAHRSLTGKITSRPPHRCLLCRSELTRNETKEQHSTVQQRNVLGTLFCATMHLATSSSVTAVCTISH